MNRRRLRVADVPAQHLPQGNQIIADINSIIESHCEPARRPGPYRYDSRYNRPSNCATTCPGQDFATWVFCLARQGPACSERRGFKMERRQVRAEAALQALLDLQAALST